MKGLLINSFIVLFDVSLEMEKWIGVKKGNRKKKIPGDKSQRLFCKPSENNKDSFLHLQGCISDRYKYFS